MIDAPIMSDLIEFGALWASTNKNGEIYFSGKVTDKLRVIVLPCRFKNGPKSPDYRIYLAPADEKPDRYNQNSNKPQVQSKPQPSALQSQSSSFGNLEPSFTEDDIPF